MIIIIELIPLIIIIRNKLENLIKFLFFFCLILYKIIIITLLEHFFILFLNSVNVLKYLLFLLIFLFKRNLFLFL